MDLSMDGPNGSNKRKINDSADEPIPNKRNRSNSAERIVMPIQPNNNQNESGPSSAEWQTVLSFSGETPMGRLQINVKTRGGKKVDVKSFIYTAQRHTIFGPLFREIFGSVEGGPDINEDMNIHRIRFELRDAQQRVCSAYEYRPEHHIHIPHNDVHPGRDGECRRC